MTSTAAAAAIETPSPALTRPAGATVFPVLLSLSFCHLLNDMNQSLLAALYPSVKSGLGLSFAQIGMVTLAYQVTASLLQPVVGLITDRRPQPHSLPIAMLVSMIGLLLLSVATSYPLLLLSAGLIGIGSSIFHPESSRMARFSSGGRHGLAQSLFQVGGNTGTALGPLLAAFIVLERGQASIGWFSLAALLASGILWGVASWYRRQGAASLGKRVIHAATGLSRRQTYGALAVLLVLIFSKYVYMASLSSYYTFYLIHTFSLSVQQAQLCLFAFLGAAALGTVIGGPVGDRIGRRPVIWVSILGVLPFTLALPHVGLTATVVLSMIIGLVLSSAFSAIVVLGQELMPHRVGTIAGLFFGLAFGIGGLGAAALGWLADLRGIGFVYEVCSVMPALGILAAFLPNLRKSAAG